MNVTSFSKKVIFHTYLAIGLFVLSSGMINASSHLQTGSSPCPAPSGTGLGLSNPLRACTITEFLVNILDILLTLALPVIVFFIIYGGFKLVTAQGEPGKITDGRKAITWAVIGGVVVLASKLILEIIQNTVNAL